MSKGKEETFRNLPRKKYSMELKKKAVERYEAGEELKVIEEELEITKSLISRWSRQGMSKVKSKKKKYKKKPVPPVLPLIPPWESNPSKEALQDKTKEETIPFKETNPFTEEEVTEGKISEEKAVLLMNPLRELLEMKEKYYDLDWFITHLLIQISTGIEGLLTNLKINDKITAQKIYMGLMRSLSFISEGKGEIKDIEFISKVHFKKPDE